MNLDFHNYSNTFLGLSYGSTQKALVNVLHLHPYKVTTIPQLFPRDFEARQRYCTWFNRHLNNNEILDLTFFTDEAWFHLSGYVNSQNYRTWGAQNPHIFVETVLHPQKVGVWIAISRRRIIGPIFFYDTINAERYQAMLGTFIDQLHDDEIQNGFFQQDNARPHVAHSTIAFLEEFYDDRIISANLWPPRSPGLTPPDCFLFGYLKNRIFANRPHTLRELEEAIKIEINNISQNMLQNVFENLKRRVNLCLENEGRHFEHLL